MYHFNYVSSKQLSPVKRDLILIMTSVQDLVRHEFTFQFEFVGSVKRKMVTQDIGSKYLEAMSALILMLIYRSMMTKIFFRQKKLKIRYELR